jgi:hypothetical protein
MQAAAIATVAGATCHPLVSRADLAVGPFVGPNPAVMSGMQPVPGRLRARLFRPVCRYFVAARRDERHASHARGRWFETSRAHPEKVLICRHFVGVAVRSRYGRDSAFRRAPIQSLATDRRRADPPSVVSSDTREVAGASQPRLSSSDKVPLASAWRAARRHRRAARAVPPMRALVSRARLQPRVAHARLTADEYRPLVGLRPRHPLGAPDLVEAQSEQLHPASWRSCGCARRWPGAMPLHAASCNARRRCAYAAADQA